MTIDEHRGAALARLTDNEKECLRRRLRPQTAKEMAIDLGISPHAVEKRLKMARAKLGLSSSLQAARLLAASEGYEPAVPQPSDLAAASALRQQPGGRIGSVLIPGVIVMSLLALLLLVTPQQTMPSARSPAAQSAPLPESVSIDSIALRKASPEEIRRFLAESFALMDRDHSGFIERAEAPPLGVGPPHPAGTKPPKGEPVTWMRGKTGQAAWIAQVDTNDDGKVSEAEFVAFSLPTWQSRGLPADWKPRG